MKKPKSEMNDWPHAEYKHEDLGPIVRGKYAKRIAATSHVVVIDPVVANASYALPIFNLAFAGV
jgi:hypothetical protein